MGIAHDFLADIDRDGYALIDYDCRESIKIPLAKGLIVSCRTAGLEIPHADDFYIRAGNTHNVHVVNDGNDSWLESDLDVPRPFAVGDSVIAKRGPNGEDEPGIVEEIAFDYESQSYRYMISGCAWYEHAYVTLVAPATRSSFEQACSSLKNKHEEENEDEDIGEDE